MPAPLDYSPPPEPRRQPYWSVLLAAWVISLPLAYALDNYVKGLLYGGPADGGVTCISISAILPALILAAYVRREWWVAALIGGLSSPVTVVALYLLWR